MEQGDAKQVINHPKEERTRDYFSTPISVFQSAFSQKKRLNFTENSCILSHSIHNYPCEYLDKNCLVMKLKQEQQREYLFDNYKVLLIILVVIGHFIEPCYDQNSFLYELKWGIVAFHMPAFIFISGYFSKRIPSIKKLYRDWLYRILYMNWYIISCILWCWINIRNLLDYRCQQTPYK